MERDEIAAPTVKDNRTVYQVLDLLNEQYASTRLVKSGTLAPIWSTPIGWIRII